MIINRKPLSSYFLQNTHPQAVQQQLPQNQLKQTSLYDQFNNYPQNKMQAWKELNSKISHQINFMIKKRNTEQKDEIQQQLIEEKKQREDMYGKENQKLNYMIFSTAKRRSLSSDDLRMAQIRNKIQQNLNLAPKKSILKIDSSFKQRNNYVKTENEEDTSPLLMKHHEDRRAQETQDQTPNSNYINHLIETPESYRKQFENAHHQRYLSHGRPSSSSEKKQKKRVQFSDTIRRLRVMYEDQSDLPISRSQIINPNKVTVTPFLIQSQNNQQQQQQQPTTQLQNDHRPFTIQSYRSALSTKLFQQSRQQLQTHQQQQQEEGNSKTQLSEKIQLMDTNFRDRLQKKLSQALEKKEELKKLQQMIQQPLQITHIQPKQLSQPLVQYLIKIPSRKQQQQLIQS